MSIKPILKGIGTYVPGLYRLASRASTGGTNSARYCYSVWLRHLVMAYKNGLSTCPHVVAEIGPGDSLGIGLAALLSGSSKYFGLDAVKYATTQKNIEIFDELVDLYKKREDIPDNSDFPNLRPYLDTYDFPRDILDEKRLNESLKPERLSLARNSLLNLDSSVDEKTCIYYLAPWNYSNIVRNESVDMIFTQAVLEHIEDLHSTYKLLSDWLKPGGFMSHQIDFKCHGTAREWNGHWAYSDFVWKLIKGKRAYKINREPHSTHIDLLNQFGFKVVCDIIFKEGGIGINKKQLSSRFKDIPDSDLTTSDVFIQSVKVAQQPAINSNSNS